MPSPFPGMDPYLEAPWIWPDVHHGMISEIQSALNAVLLPHYVARVEVRTYLSDDEDPGRQALVADKVIVTQSKPKPTPLIVATLMDEEIEEAFLKIIHVESNDVAAVVELLRPTTKIRGSRGRASFMAKRQEILNTEVHWIEIDLLRDGTSSVTDPPLRPSDYRILISRSDQRIRTRYWPVSVRHTLPTIAIPLRGKDSEIPLDLGAVLRTAYDQAAYDLSLDYRTDAEPPLQGDDAAWANELLQNQGLR